MAKNTNTARDPKVDLKNTCFLISPIGEVGTEKNKEFLDVLEYIIKPSIDNSGFNLKIVRADEIKKSGSIIKEILENLVNSNIVIADLTSQNANVFYELGVRHALSPRTILIAQSINDIPFDLKDYRTIIYDTSAKGAIEFSKTLREYLEEINKKPEKPDNPVLDRIGLLADNRVKQYKDEIDRLKSVIDNLIQEDGIKRKKIPSKSQSIKKRISRIIKLQNAIKDSGVDDIATFHREKDGNQEEYHLPAGQGNFSLFYLLDKDDKFIWDYWFLAIYEDEFDPEEEFADIRILLEKCSYKQNVYLRFVIAKQSFTTSKTELRKWFIKVRSFIPKNKRKYFSLLIWDDRGLTKFEKELGIKIEIKATNKK